MSGDERDIDMYRLVIEVSADHEREIRILAQSFADVLDQGGWDADECIVSVDRRIVGWEPVVEPWRVEVPDEAARVDGAA